MDGYTMTPQEQKKAAKAFVKRWKAKEGSEDREDRSFWIELYSEVLGVANPTYVLDFQRRVKGRKLDVFNEDAGVLIEHKSRGVSLDEKEQRGWVNRAKRTPRMVTPFEQAKWYADNITPRSVTPRWIVTCNFDEIRIHDLDEEYPERCFETILLDELPEQYHRLSFMVKKENSRMEREKELSVKAGEVVGKLYDAFAGAYIDIENSKEEQRSLNILITRIVFLLYAEDAELFKKNAFYDYMKNFQVQHMRQALIDLFAILNVPDGENGYPNERDPYLSPELAVFPYVNGGLFADQIIIPQFNADLRFLLLQEASAEFAWEKISPTIFGAVFESTLNPETRRAGGMHYTSIENIHKVTGPLFYDALKDELTAIEGLKSDKERKFKLNAFRKKIASIKVLDPACGSGNFLTETYLSLRKMENRVLEDLYGGQMVMGLLDPIQVSIDQFYGIEINDFAVEVAKTALWIAELQMLDQTREILDMWIDPLPLKSNENIVCANALRMDWNDVLPAGECDYIIGNPPFRGARWQNKKQKEELRAIFGDVKNVGDIDYVACWHKKAVEYTESKPVRCAFVSTNSICQGEQVANIWKPMFDKGVHFDFAWKTFVWDNEATEQAHVHVIIIGFGNESTAGIQPKTLYRERTGVKTKVARINAYLTDGPDVFVYNRPKPICNVPVMGMGSQPLDDGNYLFTQEEKEAFLQKEPDARKYFHPFTGAKEFLNGYTRWCLWLGEASKEDLSVLPECSKLVEAVRAYRLKSNRSQTYKAAETPTHFGTEIISTANSVVLPQTSSYRRFYIPIGFLGPEVFSSDKLRLVADATLMDFGVLSSQFHNAWMRVVAGRLKSDYIYSNKLVYNNFIWPDPTPDQRTRIEECAQMVLRSRAAHDGDSLAQMYDGISPMPENPSNADLKKYDQRKYDDLLAAHKALDAAVEAAYGVDFNGDEEKIVAHLFKLYAEKTKGE